MQALSQKKLKLAGSAIFLLKLTYKGNGLNFLEAQHDVEVSW
jgi:hypothetical protein